MAVIQVINSTYGARGQIGFRAAFVRRALVAAGIESFCLARDTRKADPSVRAVLPLGQTIPRALNAYRLFVDPRFNNRKYDEPFFSWFAAGPLRRLLRTLEGRQVVVHLMEYSLKLVRLARQEGARVIIDVPIAPAAEAQRLMRAGFAMDTPVEDWLVQREEEALAAADAATSPSRYVTELLGTLPSSPKRIFTIPFGCERNKTERSYARSTEGLTYAFAGTLSRRKGVPQLLEAWRTGPFSGDRLVLCGRITRSARELLRSAGLANVETPGHVDVDSYLRKADVFVLPTLMEGSAKAVYEAMAAGLPVVTTPSSGTIGEDGVEVLLVPAGDTAALRDAMIRLKAEPALREKLGRAAREKAESYPWSRYAESVIAAYRSIVKEPQLP